MNNVWRTRAVLCALLPLLAACASGPTFDQMRATEPPPAPTDGRFYMYRANSMAGAAVQPSIKINDLKVGDFVPGGYFYVDEPPGTYKISATTETEEAITATLTAGQTRYIRFDISMGVLVGHVAPSIIDPDQGTIEIKSLHYIGDKKDAKMASQAPSK